MYSKIKHLPKLANAIIIWKSIYIFPARFLKQWRLNVMTHYSVMIEPSEPVRADITAIEIGLITISKPAMNMFTIALP